MEEFEGSLKDWREMTPDQRTYWPVKIQQEMNALLNDSAEGCTESVTDLVTVTGNCNLTPTRNCNLTAVSYTHLRAHET